jgi:hypothetical protein
MTVNGLEIGRLAEQARHSEGAALRKFVSLAKQEGWTRERSGKLRHNGGLTGVYGWKELAWHVYVGMVRFSKVENGQGG